MLRAASADTRVALVLGNSAYSKVPALANPKNDAAAMAELFRNAGFDVVARTDLAIEEMRRTMRDFAASAATADIAVIYYAGHGIEVVGVNYQLPVDAKLSRDTDVEDEAMSMERFMRTIDPARKLRLVILDACRDNPFALTKARAPGQRFTTAARGRSPFPRRHAGLRPGAAPYSLGPGRKVLINDGSCGPGQITEMTGGDPRMQQKRSFRCVSR